MIDAVKLSAYCFILVINNETKHSIISHTNDIKNTDTQKLDHLPFNPVIFSHPRIWKATFCTFFSTFMECIMSTSSTPNMCLFSSEFAH